MRRDIPEGAESYEIPRLGYGRILSHRLLNEWYASICLFGRRVFLVHGNYGKRKWRGWVKRA